MRLLFVFILTGLSARALMWILWRSRRGAIHDTFGETAFPIVEPFTPEQAELAQQTEPAEQAEPDDLRQIEGIGPKTSDALYEAGIVTFAQLAEMDPEAIEAIVRSAGVRIITGAPASWPEQAALAAAGEWEKLADLQNQLQGGRRVD